MNLSKENLKISNVYYFLQGNINYYLHKFNLLSLHLVEQFYFRVGKLHTNCYTYNECQKTKCGCDLIKQMYSNKVCSSVRCRQVKFKSKKSWLKFREFKIAKKYIKDGKNRLRRVQHR